MRRGSGCAARSREAPGAPAVAGTRAQGRPFQGPRGQVGRIKAFPLQNKDHRRPGRCRYPLWPEDGVGWSQKSGTAMPAWDSRSAAPGVRLPARPGSSSTPWSGGGLRHITEFSGPRPAGLGLAGLTVVVTSVRGGLAPELHPRLTVGTGFGWLPLTAPAVVGIHRPNGKAGARATPFKASTACPGGGDLIRLSSVCTQIPSTARKKRVRWLASPLLSSKL